MPLDFNTPTPPANVSINPQGLSQLEQLFYHQIDVEHLHPAAQLVVTRHGKVVLDLAYGQSRGGSPVTPDTPFFTFSVSKAFTGVCIHRLIEAGQVEMDAPVAEYWPEFGQKGKETATIRHVFLHQAGIPAPHLYRQTLFWPFWRLVTWDIAHTPAIYHPGEKSAYHKVNYGFIFGEIVRRVTGQKIDQYLQEYFLDPLELKNTWMRIPRSELHRSPRLYSDHKNLDGAAFIFNRRLYRRALIPAASLHSTARDLAVFYQMLLNGGEYAGHRYLKEDTIWAAIAPGYQGLDHYLNLPVNWAYGFHVNQIHPGDDGGHPLDMGSGASLRAFGYFGMASCVVFADPEANLVFAFTCNRLLNKSGDRAQALLHALWKAVK